MAAGTRDRVLAAAKRLFTERGYNNVSMGDIAAELGMSKGNLTYHFKHKEDIVEALVPDGPVDCRIDPPHTLGELDALLCDVWEKVNGCAFYFLHYTQFAQVSPRIDGIQRQMFAKHERAIGEGLNALAEEGVVDARFASLLPHVARTMVTTGVFWLAFSRLAGGVPVGGDGQNKGVDGGDKDAVDQASPAAEDDLLQYRLQAWSAVVGLLTDRGRGELACIGAGELAVLL